MFYVLAFIAILVIFYLVVHIVSSIFKGCLITIGLAIIGLLAFFFIKSTKEPVMLINGYVIDNFEVVRKE